MKIENFIFDLGNVLLFFERKLLLRAFDIDKINSEFEKFFIDFNSGRLDEKVFFSKIAPYLKKGIDYTTFIKYWVDIFELNDFLISFIINKLKGSYRLYILSNTDPLHFNYILHNWPVFNNFDGYILSYKVGVMKPNKRIYQYAIDKYDIRPETTIFIDDLIENVKSAEELNFNTIHFINNDDCIKEIKKYIIFN